MALGQRNTQLYWQMLSTHPTEAVRFVFGYPVSPEVLQTRLGYDPIRIDPGSD
jgi:hypothetical protein